MGNHLTAAWCFEPHPPISPAHTWQVECVTGGSHIVEWGATQAAAQERLFLTCPELRGLVHWYLSPPPPPRGPNDFTRTAVPIAGDSLAVIFHRALIREFHSDRVGQRTLSSDDVLSVINRLWDEATK